MPLDMQDNPKKPLLYYYLIAIAIIFLFNAFILPTYMKMQINQVDYGTFLKLIESGHVTSVEVQDTLIAFTAVDEQGKEDVYVTGRMDDPDLVNRLYNANVKFGKVISKENSPLVNFILSWILPMVIFIGLGQFLIKKLGAKIGGFGNAMSFGRSNAKIYVEAQTGISFNDVAGQDEAKEALQEVIDFLHDPSRYTAIGAKIPKGVLLVGPPGTGKTLLAKAVAGESKVPFFSISGSEFVEMFVGLGAARVRDLFKQAQEKAPCIVFIDEIDTIGKSRGSGEVGGNDEREQTLNQLLTEMDGFNAEKGVVILAATNRPETLDKALLRPGRFDRRVPVELPDLQGREAILQVHAKNVKMGNDIDFNAIARATPGASGADLANIINEAALRAVRMGRTYVTQSDLEESVEVVIAGYERKNAVISMKDKLTIAYHEIGHALVAAKLKHSSPIHKITIVPRTSGALGFTMQIDEGERILMSKDEALDRITSLLGGRSAEEVALGSITSGASNDIEQATKIARAMVTRFGMSEEFDMMALETVTNQYLGGDTSLIVSGETASRIDAEVLKIIKLCHQRAINILEENKDKLHELTKVLLAKGFLTRIDPQPQVPLMLELIGAIQDRRPILGVPRDVIVPLTTFAEAQAFVSQLFDKGIKNLSVTYTGWMSNGVSHRYPSKAKLESKLGTKAELTELNRMLADSGGRLYPAVNFQHIKYDTMLDGFISMRDGTRALARTVATGIDRITGMPYYILSPAKLDSLVSRYLVSQQQYEFSGIHLADLASRLYGDYRRGHVVIREEAIRIIEQQLAKIKGEYGLEIQSYGINSYAIPYVSSVINLPLHHTGIDITDETVPFVPIVLHGFVHYAGEPLNRIGDYGDYLLKMVEVGAYPFFQAFNANPSILKGSLYADYYTGEFKTITDYIVDVYNELNGVFINLQNERIIDHQKLQDRVYATVYENGVRIVVNYDLEPVTIDGYRIEPKSYRVFEGE
jgi:cell division protease FtsH